MPVTAVFRVGCHCGAMTFCQATDILPRVCVFCGRALADGTAARLRALRIGHGLSTSALAAHLGLARTTAYEWEVARRPIPAERRSALAALLQLPPDLLAAASAVPAPVEESPMAPEPPESASTADEKMSPSPPPARRRVRFSVDLGCLLCGRDIGVLQTDTWPAYRGVVLRQAGSPPLPVADWRRPRCAVCGGAAMAADVTWRSVRDEARSTGPPSGRDGAARRSGSSPSAPAAHRPHDVVGSHTACPRGRPLRRVRPEAPLQARRPRDALPRLRPGRDTLAPVLAVAASRCRRSSCPMLADSSTATALSAGLSVPLAAAAVADRVGIRCVVQVVRVWPGRPFRPRLAGEPAHAHASHRLENSMHRLARSLCGLIVLVALAALAASSAFAFPQGPIR